MKKASKNIISLFKQITCCKLAYHLFNPFIRFTPRVVTLIDGGLGSQMWQFALGYSVAQKRSLPLTLNIDFYKNCGKDLNGNNNRQFLLFHAFPKIKSKYENSIENSKYFLMHYEDNTARTTYDYNQELFSTNDSIYLSQYYANAKYILDYRQEMMELFEMQISLNTYEKNILQQIQESNSCSVHIRKGDFVGRCVDVCTDFYYSSAIKEIAKLKSDVVFFIFSNDETYFLSKIRPHCGNIRFVVVEGRNEENPCVDFYLMRMCKNSIISNSGFSWMAAFLRNDKGLIFMPDHWNNDPARIESSRDAFYIPGWVKCPTT